MGVQPLKKKSQEVILLHIDLPRVLLKIFTIIGHSKGKESDCCSFITVLFCAPCAFGQMGAYLKKNTIQTV